MIKHKILLLLFFIFTLSGCQNYSVKNIFKSDINFVTDYHISSTYKDVYTLMKMLYDSNQDYLPHNKNLKDRYTSIINNKTTLKYEELNLKTNIKAIEQAFDKDFKGDRVFSLIYGITGMIDKSYNYNYDSYFYNNLEAQKLYDSARNLEYIKYKIKQHPEFFNIDTQEANNLDYIFGSLIRNQDMLATIVSDGDNRLVTKVIQNTASFFLIPI